MRPSAFYRCRLASPTAAASVRLAVRQFQQASGEASEGAALESLVLNSAPQTAFIASVRAVKFKLTGLIQVAERRELSPRQLKSLRECHDLLRQALASLNLNSDAMRNPNHAPSSLPSSPSQAPPHDESHRGEEVVSQLESGASRQGRGEMDALPGAMLNVREVWVRRQAR